MQIVCRFHVCVLTLPFFLRIARSLLRRDAAGACPMKKVARMPLRCWLYTAALVAGIAAVGYGASCAVKHGGVGGSSSSSSGSAGGGCCGKK